MRETEWLAISGLAPADAAPPEPGSVVVELTGGEQNPKLGLVIKTPGGGAVIQMNAWWGDTKALYVHPWQNEDGDMMLTGLTARLEISAASQREVRMEGRGVLTIGTGGARLHCANVRSPVGMGSRMIIDPHSWSLGAGLDSPRYGTRNWRIVADTTSGIIVLCSGESPGSSD